MVAIRPTLHLNKIAALLGWRTILSFTFFDGGHKCLGTVLSHQILSFLLTVKKLLLHCLDSVLVKYLKLNILKSETATFKCLRDQVEYCSTEKEPVNHSHKNIGLTGNSSFKVATRLSVEYSPAVKRSLVKTDDCKEDSFNDQYLLVQQVVAPASTLRWVH